jgi:hypothetical protein
LTRHARVSYHHSDGKQKGEHDHGNRSELHRAGAAGVL